MPHSFFARAGSADRPSIDLHKTGRTVLRASLTPVKTAATWVGHAFAIRKQRNELLKLDDRMLSDIGVSRGQALHEGGRAFYDVPASDRTSGSSQSRFRVISMR
ncbi:MAG: DUF1127 domain-containing protein [Pseudomonadota bacterium]